MTRQEIVDSAKIGVVNPQQSGGQSVGVISSKVYLRHEDTGFYIEVEVYRSQLKNIQLAKTLFELYLIEAYKL